MSGRYYPPLLHFFPVFFLFWEFEATVVVFAPFVCNMAILRTGWASLKERKREKIGYLHLITLHYFDTLISVSKVSARITS